MPREPLFPTRDIVHKWNLEMREGRIAEINKNLHLISTGKNYFIYDCNGKRITFHAVVFTDDDYMCPVWINKVCRLEKLYCGKDGELRVSKHNAWCDVMMFGEISIHVFGDIDDYFYMECAIANFNNRRRPYGVGKIKSYKIVPFGTIL